MAPGSQRWALSGHGAALSAGLLSPKKICILLCAIWIRATKNAYCYVQYGFARPKMKVEVEEKAPPVECSGLGILYI